MKDRIVIATSIAPFDLDKQKTAISSWIDAGFEVISCNVAGEISIISMHFPNVRFVELNRDGSALLGKPYPYAYDVFRALREVADGICGYTNSDIHVVDLPVGLIDAIRENAEDGKFIYAHRMDTESLEKTDLMQAKSYRGGFDVFFFHKELLGVFCDEEFFVGNTVWDYWCLMTPSFNGIDLVEIKQPVFYHLKHEVRWNDLFSFFMEKLANKHFDRDMQECINYMPMLMSRQNHGIFWLEPTLAEKKVAIVLTEELPAPTVKSIYEQTHGNVTIIKTSLPGERPTGDDCLFDYVFMPKAGHIYANCAIDVLISEMERNKRDAVACESMMVLEFDEYYEPLYFNSFCINTSPVLIRNTVKYGGGCYLSGMPLSNVPNDFIVLRMIQRFNGVYLYAAGVMTRKLLRSAEKYGINLNLHGICDKDSTLWSQKIYGYRICPPSELRDYDTYERVVIVSQYETEIKGELCDVVPTEKIFSLTELIRYEDWSCEQEDAIRLLLNE